MEKFTIVALLVVVGCMIAESTYLIYRYHDVGEPYHLSSELLWKARFRENTLNYKLHDYIHMAWNETRHLVRQFRDAMNRAKANRDRATEKFARVLWLNAKNFEQHLNWPQGMGKNTPSAEYYVPWFKRWLDNLALYSNNATYRAYWAVTFARSEYTGCLSDRFCGGDSCLALNWGGYEGPYEWTMYNRSYTCKMTKIDSQAEVNFLGDTIRDEYLTQYGSRHNSSRRERLFYVKSPYYYYDECKALRLNSDLTTSMIDVDCGQKIGCLCAYE